MDRHQTIGILGGAGPLATAHLHLRLIETLQDRYMMAEDEDFPSLIVDSQITPGMTVYGFMEPARRSVFASLSLRLAALEQEGALVVLPGCNTFAAFSDELRRDSVRRNELRRHDGWPHRPATLLDLPQLALDEAAARGHGKVAVFCSQTSRRLQLFETRAAALGIAIVPLSEREQRGQIDLMIGSVMSGLLRSDHGLCALAEQMAERGAEAVIIGCSELSLLPVAEAPLPLIDSAACGIDAAIGESLKGTEDARL